MGTLETMQGSSIGFRTTHKISSRSIGIMEQFTRSWAKDELNCSRAGCDQNCSRICVISVEAEDQGKPKLLGRAFVNIALKETNDHNPVIHFKMYPAGMGFASISEEAIMGTTIAVVTVTDEDYGQNSQIEIIAGNEENFFRLESGNNFAIVRLNRLLSERHSDPFRLTFRAKDDGLPSRRSLKDLEVFVLTADDKAPVLDSATVEAQVFEDSPLGSLVTVVHASGNSSLLYTIIEDTSNGSFKIGAHSGIITVAKPLSATTLHSALVRVEVKNKKPSIKSSICVITILIVGVNNNSPIFEKNYYLIETVENTPLLSVISKVRAHDEDDGINSQLSYSIVENVAKHTFAIKEKSGEIFVRRVLDRELQDRYVFTVRASDHGYPQRFGTAQVIVNVLDVNDNRPYFLQEQYFCFVRKNELPGSEIIRVEARDLDSGRYGEVGYLLYQSPMGLFELQHASGTLRLATSLGALAEREFQVLIGAKDGGGLLSLSNATVIVQIIDNDVYVLKFTPLKWNVDVAENSPTGTSIGTFAIENAERTDVRYRLSNSTLLQINERTGEIFLRQPIDREQIAIVPFTVFASVGHLTAQHSGLLQVLDRNDNSPQFEPGRSVSLSLTGHTTIGSELVRLLAVDADEGPNAIITYSIDNDHFDIGRETGVLIYRKRVENADQVQFHVIARDGGDPPLVGSIRVIVDVERDEPIHNFPAEIALTIAEGARPGTLIRTLAPVNTTRHYEFWANVPHSDEYAVWILTSGEVFVVSTLDREINPVIRIPITVAISIGSYRCQQSVLLIIYVEDINDNAPECPPTNTFSVVENDLSTSVVGVLNSIDKDAGLNGTVFFEMGERNTNFTIDRNFGVIRTTVSLDRESIDSYNLTIILSDGGGLKTECKVEITVKDVNDNAPIMKSAFYHFDVVDLKKHLIGYVRATDRDQGLNGEIRYYLARQSTHIKIDAFTGELSHDGELKPGKVYNLTIVAEDQGRPQLSTSALAFVYVREQKRCSPRFVVYPTKTIEIVESIPLGSLVASVVASACDDLIIYSILDGNYDSAFWIDPDDGTVIVVRSLDFEQRNSYRLTISASTSFGNTSILLVFDVRDINDNGPEIETDVIRVKENNEPGSLCGQIAVMDADSDNNGRVHLEILHQLPLEHQFHLDGTKLICDNVLDREHIHNHRLLVKATDYGNPTKSTQKMIAVEVEDENDNAPICRGVETFLVGSEPINVKWNCFDMDEALNGRIGYEILHATEAVTQIREDLVKIEPIQREPQRFSVRVFDRYTNESMSDDPSRKSIERYFTILPRNPSDFIHFDASLESIQVSLDTPLGTVIGRITASAPSTIEYYITSFRYDHEDVVRWLDIDRSNGQLLLVRKPTNLEVDIEITAFSNGFIASKTVSFCATIIAE
ncbi:unnamed protein product [Toxocara canis]|uniref:Protocadherin Fat 4-like n=1 Tax=Toxocara canis TaxID=6265 RepID=A0A183V664_TOXCA|nr:unnamed protein product [Toxocara canis]